MARGDAYVLPPTSTANNAFLAFQPGSGEEIVLHNIYVPAGTAVEIYWYDGTNSILIDTASESWVGMQFHCTNTRYVRAKNVSGSTAHLAGDGMYSK